MAFTATDQLPSLCVVGIMRIEQFFEQFYATMTSGSIGLAIMCTKLVGIIH